MNDITIKYLVYNLFFLAVFILISWLYYKVLDDVENKRRDK